MTKHRRRGGEREEEQIREEADETSRGNVIGIRAFEANGSHLHIDDNDDR